MKRFIWIILLSTLLLIPFGGHSTAAAAEVDVLINKLVEKGLLTQEEAKALLMDMQKESAREDAQVKQIATETAKEVAQKETKTASVDLPDWLKRTKFYGDMRLRYQGQDQFDFGDLEDEWRDRGRFRLRVGADLDIDEHWKTGFRLASGDNPRSTNVTLGDFFSGDEFSIRRAYIQYSPWKWVKAVGGKFGNALFQPKDMLWDTDISPEGVAATFEYGVYNDVKMFFTPTFLLLREFSLDDEIYMYPMQLGVKWKISEDIDLTVAGTYNGFTGLSGAVVPADSSASNSLRNGRYIYDYDSWEADVAVGFNLPYSAVPYLQVYGQYINADTNSQDTGYLGGFKFGHKKIKKFGQWQANLNYRYLERNAWPDFLPDSDFFGGSTNSKGYEIEFTFGLTDRVSAKLDWYSTKKIDKEDPALGVIDQNIVLGLDSQDLLQLDLVVKF